MDYLLIVKSLFFLCFVLLLIYGIFLVLRKKFQGTLDDNQRIKILAYKKINQKLSVSLLEVDGQKLLIAETSTTISCIDIKNGINDQ